MNLQVETKNKEVEVKKKMPIDEQFRSKYKKIGKHQGHDVWKLNENDDTLGIHGTKVAVDFDICNGCMKCVKKCTVNVFIELKTPDHHISKVKADPVNELDCFDCLVCLMICPVEAINVKQEISDFDTLNSLLDS